MVHYFLKSNGQKVNIGDRISMDVPTQTPYGEAMCKINCVVTEDTIKQLLNDGLIEEMKTSEDLMTKYSRVYYRTWAKKVAKDLDISKKEAYIYLESLMKTSPYGYMNALMEFLSSFFLTNEDISKCKNVYIINFADGPMVKEIPNSFVCIPCFAKKAHAIAALGILHDIVKNKYVEQEDKKC